MTTDALARLIGCSRRTVQLSCNRIGITREGRDFVLTPEQAKAIEHDIRSRPLGRPPRKGKKA